MNGVKKVYNWFGSKSTIAALLLLLIFSDIAFASKNFLAFDSLMNVARKAASDGGNGCGGDAFLAVQALRSLEGEAAHLYPAQYMHVQVPDGGG